MIEVLKQAIDYIENVPDDRDNVGHIDRRALVLSLNQAIAELESQEPFGIWHQGATDEESDFYLYSESGDVSCPTCIKLYTHPPQRTEPLTTIRQAIANDAWAISFQTFGQYRTALLKLIDAILPAQTAKPIPCANHCEATAFEIVIKNLQGEIERLKALRREWVGLKDEELRIAFGKLYPSDIGILELAENNKDYAVEAIGARHHWTAFKAGARAGEAKLKEKNNG